MDTMTSVYEDLTATLPSGYAAREFADRDREALVAERNAQVHELQRGDADEWRDWERIQPPKDELRIVVVAPDGAPVATGEVGPGRFVDRPDGTLHGSVGVARAHHGKGIGSTLLGTIEGEARRRGAPRILSNTSVAFPGALEWAERRGYREIGRRIESYVDVTTFDPTPFAETIRAVTDSGIRLTSMAELVAGRDEAGRDAFWRELYEAEAPMWDDVPWATPTPHWDYERFRRMAVDSGKLILEASVVALDGTRIAGFTTQGRQKDRGYTWMTGTAREYRGRGIALAMKVDMLRRAREAGLRAMLTTNDEPNKAMRGINAKLGYVMLPAHVELERAL